MGLSRGVSAPGLNVSPCQRFPFAPICISLPECWGVRMAKSETTKVSGGCLCGLVRYEAEVFLKNGYICHCTVCQKSSGQPAELTVLIKAGTLKYLKLEGVDWGYDHDVTKIDPSQFDGLIDTWIYDKATYGLTTDIVATNSVANSKYRVPLFPNTMNVKSVKFFLFPNKDTRFSWKDNSAQVNINPYLRMEISLTPSRKKRKWLRWAPPVYTYSTTISLTDIFSK